MRVYLESPPPASNIGEEESARRPVTPEVPASLRLLAALLRGLLPAQAFAPQLPTQVLDLGGQFGLVRLLGHWPDGITCPYCGGWENSFIASRKIWRCRPCKKQFSVKVGTIFEDSPIRLGKWFTGIWLLTSCKNGISSYEISRALDVTQKTAWFLLHRIRAAIKAKSFDKKLAGIVETDECFIGGLFKNMHESKKQAIRDANTPNKRSGIGKTIVQAVLERDGEIRAQILTAVKDAVAEAFVKAAREILARERTAQSRRSIIRR